VPGGTASDWNVEVGLCKDIEKCGSADAVFGGKFASVFFRMRIFFVWLRMRVRVRELGCMRGCV
jgi:hypothetical protein